MKWIAVLLLAVGCAKPTPGLMESCQTSADCSQGLVCLGNKCGECRQDSECPGVAKCGLVQAGRCGCYDADGDGASCDDCDDADPARFPGAAEVCDMRDNNCDGTIDEGTVTTWFVDADGDGYGNGGLSLMRCQAPANFVARGGDCNDSDPTTFPGRTEVCDGRDNNCDGTIDEGVKSVFYRDADGDGFGDFRNTANVCQIPAAGFVAIADDCDDSRADANPQAMETCNNRDDDCDGIVDGLTRSCTNACGSGQETCTRGVWGGCTAPPITTVTATMNVTGASASYDCVVVTTGAKLTVGSDVTLSVRNWLHVDSTGTLELGPRSTIDAVGDIVFSDRGILLASDATLRSATSVQLTQDAKWYAQASHSAPYSSGGSGACAPPMNGRPLSGAGGGARGGTGGRGSSCDALISQPRVAAGGPLANNGADGCGCNCFESVAGGLLSGGGGGASLAGGGGGANGGRGGSGGGGLLSTTILDGGNGGLPEGDAGVMPEFGGGGGGSGGAYEIEYGPQACQGFGGAGGGIVRVQAPLFSSTGVLSADGADGDTRLGFYAHGGGGGAGAGGTWFFRVDRFDNRGSISAVGGRGGDSISKAFVPVRNCGGGGGGGGGRFHLEAADGGSATVVTLGNIFVGGGVGGTGLAGNGEAGAPGSVFRR